MFEHYIFGAMSQPHQDDIDVSTSPTDTSFPLDTSPSPSPSLSFSLSPSPSACSFPSSDSQHQSGIGEIVDKLSTQSLSRDNLVAQFAAWSQDSSSPISVDDNEEMPPFESTKFLRHAASFPTTAIDTPAAHGAIACRRMQRQLNVQMQSSTHHIRDINALVEDMIGSNTQCRLHRSTSRPYLPNPALVIDTTLFEDPSLSLDVDEGFHEDPAWNVEEEISLRRASTPSGIRKNNTLRWGRSADVICVGGRVKVKSKPRMRKRKVPKVVE